MGLVMVVLVLVVGALVLRTVRLNSDLQDMITRVSNLKEDLNSTLQGIESIKALLPDDSWQPQPGDLVLVGSPQFRARPMADDPAYKGKVRWSVGCIFVVENNFREDLLVFFEIEYECDPKVCVQSYQPYAKGGVEWRDGWRRLWDLDDVSRPNVLLVPSGGRVTVDSLSAELVTPIPGYYEEGGDQTGQDMNQSWALTFPWAAYAIRGTTRLEHGNLQHTFKWGLASGVLNQSECAIITGEARTVVLRENATLGSRKELDLYIDEKKALLEELSASAPDRLAPASVSFKRPIEVTELGRIIEEYCLEWEYLEYEGDKIRGGYSRRILEDLSDLGELVRRDVGEDVAVVGVTYINGGATLKDLNRLDTHPDVILVDLGPFKKAEDLRSQGYDVVTVPGRNLYDLYNEYR